MYRMMQSEKFLLEYPTYRPISIYRQRMISQYREIQIALDACHKANALGRHCYYVLNEQGQEHYAGIWID